MATSSWAARREEPVGSELLVFGRPVTVYGRLGKTAVGIHERGLFLSFATMDGMSGGIRKSVGDARAGSCRKPCPGR